MKKRPQWLILLLTLLLPAHQITAAVLWKFSTTGQGQTISGTLTTDGTDADLSSAKNFNIQSIETLLLDGAPVATLATPLPWVNGVSANVSVGPLIWNGSSVQLPIFVLATSDGGDLLEIDNNNDPEFPNFKARIQDVVAFDTESTSITPLKRASQLIDFGFNEGTGTTVTDTINSLSGSPAVPANPPTFETATPSAKPGDSAVHFEAGQYFIVNDPDTRLALDPADPSFTLQAWVNFAGNPAGRQVFYYANGPGGAVSFSVNNNRTVFVTTLGIADVSSAAAIPDDGAWHHIAVVHQPGVELRFYVDGVLGDTVPYTSGVNFTRTQKIFSIGAEWNGALQYIGSVDRLKVSSGILAPDELDFQAVPPSKLIDFGFDEGSGTTVTDSINSLAGSPAVPANPPTFESEAPSGLVGDSAVHFEPGQYFVVNDPDTRLALDPTNPSFTLQAWVKFNGNPAGRQVFYYANGPGGAVSFSVNNNRTVFVTTLGIADVSSSAAIPDDGAWHHIAVVHQPGVELRFYVDGVLGDTRPYTSGVNFTRTQKIFSIGAEWNGALQYIGSVDRLKVSSGMLGVEQLDYRSIPLAGDGGLTIARPSVSPLGFSLGVTDAAGSVLDPATILLTLDGAPVVPTSVTKSGATTTIAYTVPGLPLASGSSHTVNLAVKDTKSTSFSKSADFVVASYASLSASDALPDSAVDKNARGFRIRTFQIEGGTKEGTIAYNEAILTGENGPNIANADDAGGVDAEGFFIWPSFINFDTGTGANGYFNSPDYPNIPFPGIPGALGTVVDFAEEILAALEFTAPGIYTMAVNTDWTGFPNSTDGYLVRAGLDPKDPASSVTLGFFDALAPVGTRGLANTPFQFYVPKAGIYPFRLMYYQSEGSANLEWYMLNTDGTRTLINEPDKVEAVPAYYTWTTPPTAPTVSIASGVNTVTITFTGTLEETSSLTNPVWSAVAGAGQITVPTTGPSKFYRSRQ
ncbi:MAG: LamG domain-containing protein [Verrucomicrobiales bacterium]|nr:LamG domain-containing protein [Verrucomicrobiales bacterium]